MDYVVPAAVPLRLHCRDYLVADTFRHIEKLVHQIVRVAEKTLDDKVLRDLDKSSLLCLLLALVGGGEVPENLRVFLNVVHRRV